MSRVARRWILFKVPVLAGAALLAGCALTPEEELAELEDEWVRLSGIRYQCPSSTDTVYISPLIIEKDISPQIGYATIVWNDPTTIDWESFYGTADPVVADHVRSNIDQIKSADAAILAIYLNSRATPVKRRAIFPKETWGHLNGICWARRNVDRLVSSGFNSYVLVTELIDAYAVTDQFGPQDYKTFGIQLGSDAPWLTGEQKGDWPSCQEWDLMYWLHNNRFTVSYGNAWPSINNINCEIY
jgi:hypothetical protein